MVHSTCKWIHLSLCPRLSTKSLFTVCCLNFRWQVCIVSLVDGHLKEGGWSVVCYKLLNLTVQFWFFYDLKVCHSSLVAKDTTLVCKRQTRQCCELKIIQVLETQFLLFVSIAPFICAWSVVQC